LRCAEAVWRETGVTQVQSAPTAKKKIYEHLYFQVLCGMIIGVLLGYFYPKAGGAMKPLGDGFIKLIRMVIAPIIFCTVVHGIASMSDLKKVGKVALKALIYFEAVTTLALVVSLVIVNVWQPGAGMNIDPRAIDTKPIQAYTTQAGQQSTVEFLLHVIPGTIVGAFAEGEILQVLFFSVLFGFALSFLGERGKPALQIIELVSQTFFRIVGIIMRAAPLGAFGAIAFTVGAYGVGSLLALGKLVFGFYFTCLFFVFVVLGTISYLAGFSLIKLMRYIKEEILICFATTSSETVLPRIMVKLENLGCEESVVGLVIPTGYSFNLDGTCLYLVTAAVFLAQATNTPLGLEQQLGLIGVLLLTSKGAAGVTGAAFIVLAATLASVGTIPVASIALILGIHRFMSEALVPTNLIGNAVATIIVCKWEKALDERKMQAVLAAETDVEAEEPEQVLA
jgi:aerobic C4-dicarboxylate transport protein